jgi:hypothetical protein
MLKVFVVVDVSNVICLDSFVKFILLLYGHYLSVLDIPL